jgi:hypothetical protein
MKWIVYKIVNKKNNLYYIGMEVLTLNSLNDFNVNNKFLVEDVEELGIRNFKKTIIETFDDEKKAYLYKYFLIHNEIIDNDTYNQMYGEDRKIYNFYKKLNIDNNKRTVEKTRYINIVTNIKNKFSVSE